MAGSCSVNSTRSGSSEDQVAGSCSSSSSPSGSSGVVDRRRWRWRDLIADDNEGGGGGLPSLDVATRVLRASIARR